MTQTTPIKIVRIPVEIFVSEKYAQNYGGINKLTALLEDILDRYGNEAYFDSDLMEMDSEEFE